MDSTLPCWHQENVRRLAFNTIHSGTASHCSQNLSDYVEKKALRTLIRQQARSLRVMAGFRWAPLMWPIHCPNMAIARPKANVTFISRSGVRMILVPQLKPDNKDGHSQGLSQNHPLVLIFDMAMCFMSLDANIPCGTGQQSNWKHNEWHSVSFIRCVALKKKRKKESGLMRSSWEKCLSTSRYDLHVSCCAQYFSSLTEGSVVWLLEIKLFRYICQDCPCIFNPCSRQL